MLIEKSRILVFFLLITSVLSADWNQSFDEQTRSLIQQLPILQNKYSSYNEYFIHERENLLNKSHIKEIIESTQIDHKKIINDDELDIIIKKRRNNHIHDLYAWEISNLLGTSYVVPAFPMEIGGKRVIIQIKELFQHGNMRGGGHSKSRLKKMSLETYWKAHLQAYILGLSDLAAANIGIDSEGIVRFFDNEASLIYYNKPRRTEFSFSTGFITHSFDWPHYRKPLDQKTAKILKEFAQTLDDFEKNLRIYSLFRPVTLPNEGMLFRLEKIKSFSFEPGKTFRDFFGSVYPRMSPGLDELNSIVSQIAERQVDHGGSLFFVCRSLKKHKLTRTEKKIIENWIKTYVD